MLLFQSVLVQSQSFHKGEKLTRQDTLRGSITPERAWWDVVKYDLAVTPNFKNFTISGSNTISFKLVKKKGNRMQIDLQDPLIIDSAILNGVPMKFTRDGHAWYIEMPKRRMPKPLSGDNNLHQLYLVYHGVPKPALRAPWDGGVVWKKDKNGNPWINVACQGLGASVWWPCKDHQSDEPDNGVSISITAPDTLMNVSNGRLKDVVADGKGNKVWTWVVTNPINLYDVTMNVGKYVHFSDTLQGEKGKLDLDYYVIDYNLDKAKKQFEQVKPMLRAFEYWFGPYPFYEDGYKLVESHHLGMEHQSAVAYGNEYMNGYRGNDLSGTGWGMKFDFIIIHESGHEWYGNNISSKDIADMWVHEGFTNYSETLYTDYLFGTEAGDAYVQGVRKNIRNDIPIVGKYNVNKEGSDMYPKAANMIHMVRQIIGDRSTFRMLLRDMNEKYYHKTVTGAEIEDFMSKRTGFNLGKMFDQYLRTTQVPTLEYYFTTEAATQVLNYRWTNCVKGFNMPILLPGNSNPKYGLMLATENWQKMRTNFKEGEDISKLMDKNFYVNYKKVK